MKNYCVTLIIAFALAITIVISRQRAQAQNTSPQPMNQMGGTMADAAGAKTNNPDAIFVTKIPHGYRDWKLISVAHEEGSLNDIRATLAFIYPVSQIAADVLPMS